MIRNDPPTINRAACHLDFNPAEQASISSVPLAGADFREFRAIALTGIGNTLAVAFRGDDDHRACKPRHDFGEDVST